MRKPDGTISSPDRKLAADGELELDPCQKAAGKADSDRASRQYTAAVLQGLPLSTVFVSS